MINSSPIRFAPGGAFSPVFFSARRLNEGNRAMHQPTTFDPGSTPETNATFQDLRALNAELAGVNAHDRATVTIAAIIESGMNTANQILGAMVHLGFNRRHAAIILRAETGNDPKRYGWRRDADGVFTINSGRLERPPLPDLG
jgi:hypothetical protein